MLHYSYKAFASFIYCSLKLFLLPPFQTHYFFLLLSKAKGSNKCRERESNAEKKPLTDAKMKQREANRLIVFVKLIIVIVEVISIMESNREFLNFDKNE